MTESYTKTNQRVGKHDHQDPPHQLLDAALWYASKGIKVFPIRPGKKTPLIKGGFHRGTTDPQQIRKWWTRWPQANIATPTSSEFVVLDVDPDKGGGESLTEPEAKHGQLPRTTTVMTPRKGVHFWLKNNSGTKIRNSAGKVGAGLDIRAEGGYVLLPPSRTEEGEYHFLADARPAEIPSWLLGLATAKPPPPRGGGGLPPAAPTSLLGDPIEEGIRNSTLASIGGGLRARGWEYSEILDGLLFVNRRRCEPALPGREVEAIARSVSRYEKGTGNGGATPEVIQLLGEIEQELLVRRAWSGSAASSEYSVIVALIWLARLHGKFHDKGVRVEVDVRNLALLAAVSKTTIVKITKRLVEKGNIAREKPRNPNQSGAFILISPRAKLIHPTTNEGVKSERVPVLRAPRLRRSVPDILRLGKSCERIVDIIEAADGMSVTLQDLADRLGAKRPRDLRRRQLARLEGAGIVTVAGDRITLAEDYLALIERERIRTGEVAAKTRDREMYERERGDHQDCLAAKAAGEELPDKRKPSEAEYAARAELEEIRRRARQRKRFRRDWDEHLQRRTERIARARVLIADPETRVGKIYLTNYGDDPEILAGAIGAHDREPQAWRAWIEPVREALRALNGEMVEVAC